MMDLAESRIASLRGHLFGEGEDGANPAPAPSSVRGMVDDLATRLACLCGQLATINERMGCMSEGVVPNEPAGLYRNLHAGALGGSALKDYR